jgi:peptide subunit release factor 1 (eRF1)
MFDLDCATILIECPRCNFHNSVTMRQVRLHDVVICRGCKSNMQLVDYMGTVSNAREDIWNSQRNMMETLSRTISITLRF